MITAKKSSIDSVLLIFKFVTVMYLIKLIYIYIHFVQSIHTHTHTKILIFPTVKIRNVMADSHVRI